LSFITDRKHLLSLSLEGIQAIEYLAKAWLAEDEAAHTPLSGVAVPVSGGGISDPTGRAALDDTDRYAARDRLGKELYGLIDRLKQARKRREPRAPGGPCSCCDRDTATHGQRDDGTPADCFPCWRYRRKHGYRCTDDVHQLRPDVRMCECPPQCCDPCPDRVAPSRTTLSDRCAQRKARGMWARSA